MLFLTLIVCFFISILITSYITKVAYKVGATDRPNIRKVHQTLMPRTWRLSYLYKLFSWGFNFSTRKPIFDIHYDWQWHYHPNRNIG